MPKRVLVVDDNLDTVRSMVELFRALGHDAKGCYNGREAVRSAQEYDPDAVIMDISMPDISGEAARVIRESVPGKRPLLIAVTGDERFRSLHPEARRPREAARADRSVTRV